MAGEARFHWVRVVVAVVAAEALPILALVAVVFVYSFTRRADSRSPEEFAPVAGMWVGPIGGFLATLLFAWWAGKRSSQRPMVHGTAVGLGTALLDLGIGMLLSRDEPLDPVFFLSNGGRFLAGVLGGWLASRAAVPTRS